MEKRDTVILLLALTVVVVMAVVVKPILTGKSPDLSLPSLPGSTPTPGSPVSTPGDVIPPTIPAGTTSPTPSPALTWNGSAMDLWYVPAGTTAPSPPLDTPSESSGYVSPVTKATTPTPGFPTASFSATPRDGPVPLPVQFTDTSVGIPDSWTWSFGDGTISSLQHPLHTYTSEGSYQVSLKVENALGGNTRINQGYITVTTAGKREVVIEAQRGAMITPGGFIEFSVTKPGSRIKIGGLEIDLPDGTRVRLVVDDQGKGKISVKGGSIQEYSFEQVVLYVNGTFKQKGAVREILIQEYDGLISSLELDIDGGTGDVHILENGFPVNFTGGQSPLFLVSIRPDSAGVMALDCYWPDSMFFQGAVTSYTVS